MSTRSGLDDRSSFLPDSKTIEILHVEDDRSFADLVSTFLEREHEAFSVHTETDPREALAALRGDETAYDCVVSDYDMPGLNGLELLERVRRERPNLPFVLFTGKGSEEIASEAITAGVTDYLQKSGGTEQYRVLANRIRNAVERYWAERYMNRGLEAIETARDGISILSEDGHVEYANTACAEVLGYDREDLIGRHWETFYRDDDVEEVYDVLLPEARESRWRGPTTFIRRDDEPVEVDHTLSYTDDGSLICTLSRSNADGAVSRDLSAKERAMDEAPIGIVLTDPRADDNPIVYANEEFGDLTGYDRSEVIGRNCRFLQGERTDEERIDRIRSAIDAEEPVTVELRNYRKDGTEFWNRLRIAPIYDEDDDLYRFVGFQDDVTERKRREDRLRSNSAHLEALFTDSPDMIAVHDADGVIRNANRRLCEELGYTEAELVGRTVWDLDPTVDPKEARSFWAGLPTNEPRRFEGELERRDGSTFPIEIHLIRMDIDGEDRFVAIDRDITEQRARESELLERNERLDRFASVVSHDLRNPLTVAEGRIELLREEHESEHVEEIDDALDRMRGLIEDLLVLAQDGEDALDVSRVELADLTRTCWDAIETGDATLRIETDRTVRADREQLRQLLENLVVNAVEHGGDDVTVTIGDTETGFYVADDGSGLPATDADVFEAGYSTVEGGTGFGLHIVENVVETHDWEVTAENGPAGGARFEISTSAGE
ncbi:PAS domain S-box-containing protein [Halorubrum aquaticum]|uniref:histidine kinase n=1 Tax=Halorubrum aquaticum TaxID=387340 RepID=A0A1I2ZKF7_9EURY|nr:PAS domain S-box protein [Halorubrum aquaticum]SFH38190.1 PAS domain S-box-containing protein [Halorubrum aquaticum]